MDRLFWHKSGSKENLADLGIPKRDGSGRVARDGEIQ
jgi:hypothetical protein